MTKEEIIEFCEMKAELEPENEDIYEAIIKALEQEPILDNGGMTIGQIYESAKRRLDKNEITIGEFCNIVDITVDAYKPPIGHNCNEDYADCDQFVCSECGIELQDWHRVERDLDDGDISYHEYTFKFCPNCGARMAESEDVLAEIKAEIEQKCCITVGSENEPAITLYDVFQIIDKYRTESKDKPKGRWIDIGDEGLVFKCSLCGLKKTIESHYCPNCGAIMTESEEEE